MAFVCIHLSISLEVDVCCAFQGPASASEDLQPFIPLPDLPNWAWQQRTSIMGILNVTPDSFSDGGQVQGVKGAVEHACSMVQQGADIIDVGGQSTRPGATRLTTQDEVHRVIPVIRCAHRVLSATHYVPTTGTSDLHDWPLW